METPIINNIVLIIFFIKFPCFLLIFLYKIYAEIQKVNNIFIDVLVILPKTI